MAALSLVLCVATVGMWVRSYRIVDECAYAGASFYDLYSANGKIYCESTARCPYQSPLRWIHGRADSDSGERAFNGQYSVVGRLDDITELSIHYDWLSWNDQRGWIFDISSNQRL